MRRPRGKATAFLIGVGLLAAPVSVPVASGPGPLASADAAVVYDRTNRQAMIDAFNQVLRPAMKTPVGWTGNLSSCTPGTESAQSRRATIDAVNYFRQMAGVQQIPYDSTKDNETAAAALLMLANKKLSHSPPPDWTCYSAEAAAGAKANIAFGTGGWGAAADGVDMYMDDATAGNEIVGHRRSVISPTTKSMSSGSAQAQVTMTTSTGTTYTTVGGSNALWVKDQLPANPAGTPQYLPWPPAGYVPAPLGVTRFPGLKSRWSLSIPAGNAFTNPTVGVRRLDTNQQLPVTVQAPRTNLVGLPDTVVFDFDPGFAPGSADRTYEVTVKADTLAYPYTYRVTLVDPGISFPQPPTVSLGENYLLRASVPYGKATQISNATPSVCSVNATGEVTPITTGTCTITVSSGDANYKPAPVTRSFTIDKRPLTVTANDVTRIVGSPNPALGYTITGLAPGDTLAGAGITGTASCTTTATSASPAGSYPITCTRGSLTDGPKYRISNFVAGTLLVSPDFSPITPARLMDTRPGSSTVDAQFAGTGPVAAGTKKTLKVAGRGGVPATGTYAVVLNVTAVRPPAKGFLAVDASFSGMPASSNLNYIPGVDRPNQVISRLSPTGTIELFSGGSTSDVIVDVVGWFPVGSSYSTVVPARLLDTRPGASTVDGLYRPARKVAPGQPFTLKVAGRGGVPATAGAVVLNVTAHEPNDGGYLSVYPGGTPPKTSNVNFINGQTTPNLVVARVASDGTVTMITGAGKSTTLTDVFVDVFGYFPATGTSFNSLSPVRLMDSRPGTSTVDNRYVNTGQVYTTPVKVQVTGRGGVPATGVTAVVLNVTAASPAGGGFLSVYPAKPAVLTSSLNYHPGQDTPNLVVTKVASDGTVTLQGGGSPSHVIIDVAGWF